MPDVTLVIACRNEETYLPRTLDSLIAQELGPLTGEIIFVDGESDDRSREIIQSYVDRAPSGLTLRLLPNPQRTTPFAFNIGIRAAQSPVIGFGGSHTSYPPSYLRRAVELIGETGADVVGGGLGQFIANSKTVLAEACRCLYQSPMGAGVAAYVRRKEPGFVDTVYGGFYRREVFDRVGVFNERLARNQDNELNARVTAAGLKVFFHPDLSTAYVQKTDLKTFFRRALMFGRYHPVTWLESPESFRVRHAVPAFFVLYLLLVVTILASGRTVTLLFVPLVIYAILLLLAAWRLRERTSSVAALATIPLFCAYHVIYGLGTLAGAVEVSRSKLGARR
jgi:glycosyltransferase involved in cell wall biosynthesis